MVTVSSGRGLVLLTLLSLLVGLVSAAGTDKTLIEKEKGRDVVDAVVNKIVSSNIFPPDFQLLRRVAYVETKDGESADTFRPNFFGGIWNVDQRFFVYSQDSKLADFHSKINTAFGIDWAKTSWTDLLKPLYSGLAARLFLEYSGKPIPQSLREQGLFWALNYNTHDDWTNATFVNRTEEFDNGTVICSGKMDLVIVMDGSESLGYPNYEICKRFVRDIVRSRPNLENVRSGYIVFSSEVSEVFSLGSRLSIDDRVGKIVNFPFPATKTNTNEALIVAKNMFQYSAAIRPGVPRVMTIVTDGVSNPKGVGNIKDLEALGITSYVIGIGEEVDRSELEELSYYKPENMFVLDDFDILLEFYKKLNEDICKIPEKPEPDTPTEDILAQGELRYYSFEVTEEGLTIAISTEKGSTIGYYSFSMATPNSAVHEGILSYYQYIPLPDEQSILDEGEGRNVTLYVSIQGLSPSNEYTIEAVTGQAAAPTTSPAPDEDLSTTPGGALSVSLTFTLGILSIFLKSMAQL